MGLIERVFSLIFGGGRNALAETAEVFRINAENADARASELQGAALDQLAAEFAQERKGRFDRLIDGLNRIPRPAMALGTLALFVAAMVDPIWFSERMQGISLVPDPLWWLLGAIVSFYFGARHQAKGQEFQRSLAATMARTPQVVDNIHALRALDAGAVAGGDTSSDPLAGAGTPGAPPRAGTDGDNPALAEWRRQQG